MGKHIIFVFTGTGNSLWAAREIAKGLEDCEIVSMGRRNGFALDAGYETVGFVYPTYGRGMPLRVGKFVAALDLSRCKDAYIYAVSSCGNPARAGNSLSQLGKLLSQKGVALRYAEHLRMFSNYIIMYDMPDAAKEKAQSSAQDLRPMIERIWARATGEVSVKNQPLQQLGYLAWMASTPKVDKHFGVSDACVSCGICVKVCPVANIALQPDGKPGFHHHCEQCTACIQICPAKAINYKDKTQNRRRYIHPDVTWQDLAKLNEAKGL